MNIIQDIASVVAIAGTADIKVAQAKEMAALLTRVEQWLQGAALQEAMAQASVASQVPAGIAPPA